MLANLCMFLLLSVCCLCVYVQACMHVLELYLHMLWNEEFVSVAGKESVEKTEVVLGRWQMHQSSTFSVCASFTTSWFHCVCVCVHRRFAHFLALARVQIQTMCSPHVTCMYLCVSIQESMSTTLCCCTLVCGMPLTSCVALCASVCVFAT